MDEQKKVSSVEEAEAHFAAEADVSVLAVKGDEEKLIFSLDDAKEFFEVAEEEGEKEEEAA